MVGLIASTAFADAGAGAAWVVVTAALGLAAWRWAARLFPGDPYLDQFGHAVVLWWGGIVAVATTIGSAGLLTGPALLGGAGLIAGAALVADARRPVTATPGEAATRRADGWWLAPWVALSAAWASHVIVHGLGTYPSDWDSVAYHLPMVDQWIQAGSLWTTRSNRWANPGNNELLALWLTAPFSGDFLVALSNLPAAALLGCGGVALARRLGLPRGAAHLAGLALVSVPVVTKQLVDQDNDVAAAACFVAVLGYAFRDHARPSPSARVLGAICLGLLAGVKYYALGYAGLALGVWVGMSASTHGWRAAARVLAAGAAGLVLFGGFWYARNWVATGTPLYPQGFTPATNQFAHIYPDVHKTTFFGNRRPELLGLYTTAIWQWTGPFQLTGFVLAPASVAWFLGTAVRAARRDGGLPGAPGRVALATLVTGTGVLLGITPMAVEDRPGTLNQMHMQYCPVRYGFCFLSTAALVLLVLLWDLVSRLAPPDAQGRPSGRSDRTALAAVARDLFVPVLGGGVLFQLAWVGHKLDATWLDALLVSANLSLAGAVCYQLRNSRGRVRIAIVLAAVAGSAWTCDYLSGQWHRGFRGYYEAKYQGVARYAPESAPPQSVLMLQYRCYPYFGSDRRHQVYQPDYLPSAEWLMGYIRTNGITVLVAEEDPSLNGGRRYAALEECLERYPAAFRQLVEGHPRGVVFEIVRDPAAVSGAE